MCCHCMNRREFMELAMTASAGVVTGLGAGAAGGVHAAGTTWQDISWEPSRPLYTVSRPLRVLPVLMYRVPRKREMTSYKSWGGVQSHEIAAEESERISGEWCRLRDSIGFPLEVQPVVRVTNPEEAAQIDHSRVDLTVVYPATGSGDTLRACIPERGAVLFARHKSGPVYYWYEALSTRYLAKTGEQPDTERRVSVRDVVIDNLDELRWRLRAWNAVNNLIGCRVATLGGFQGKYAPEAPEIARRKWGIEIINLTYADFEKRLKAAFAYPSLMAQAERWADTFLSLPGTALETERSYVVNAFVLYALFKQFMAESGASVFSIMDCMSAIMPMSRTTACLTLGLLNDEGLIAFCESDFVVIPAGILLRHIAGVPVFMHNSTFPHDEGIVTCAHCACPRRLDGQGYASARILTHYESDFGAAPKVEMPLGQMVTFINPEYATGRWLGLRGVVRDNPFYEICRSQQDVQILGPWERLLNEVRDSHWMMAYGDHLQTAGYAASKIGVQWDPLI